MGDNTVRCTGPKFPDKIRVVGEAKTPWNKTGKLSLDLNRPDGFVDTSLVAYWVSQISRYLVPRLFQMPAMHSFPIG